jgi:hypothetical protein
MLVCAFTCVGIPVLKFLRSVRAPCSPLGCCVRCVAVTVLSRLLLLLQCYREAAAAQKHKDDNQRKLDEVVRRQRQHREGGGADGLGAGMQ